MQPRRPSTPSQVQFEQATPIITEPGQAAGQNPTVGAWRERFEAENARWAQQEQLSSQPPAGVASRQMNQSTEWDPRPQYPKHSPTRGGDDYAPARANELLMPTPTPTADPRLAANEPRVSPRPLGRPARPTPEPAAPTPAPQPPQPERPAAVTPPAAPPSQPVTQPPSAPTSPATVGETPARLIDSPPAVTTIRTEVDPLVQRVQERSRTSPQDLAAQLDLQLLKFLRDERVPSAEALSGLSREDREILIAMLDGLSNFRSAARLDGNMLPSQKVQPILEMADRIRAQAELSIPTLALCSRVTGFGVYDPLPTTFRAGIDVPVIVYCEVANFSSRLNAAKQMWETRLSMAAVLYTESGVAIWNSKNDVPADLARNRRHDFFVVKRVLLPKTMAPGQYVLKVTISDEQANRIAENSIDVTMVAAQ